MSNSLQGSRATDAGTESMTSFVGPLGGQFSFTTAKFGESPVFHRVRVDVSGEAHVMVFFTTRGAVPAAGK